jgi:hypothetical protein
MRLFYNLTNNAITLSIDDSNSFAGQLPLKGGQNEPVELQFHRAGVPERLAVDTALDLAIKPPAEFEAELLTDITVFTRPGSDDGFYTATLPTDTSAIRTLLVIDGNPANDLAFKESCLGEVQYRPSGAEKPTKSRTFFVRLENWVIQGDEDPTEIAYSFDDRITALETARVADEARIAALEATVGTVNFLPAVTGYTGGTSADLDGVPTVGVTVGKLYYFDHATDGLRWYRLLAGTTAEASPSVIRPDDYDGSTNAKYFQSRS